MKTYNLKNMIRGWFIGNFEPSLYKTNFEVGVKRYKSGDKEKKHYHKLSKEFTVIIQGVVKMNGVVYKEDDIIQIDEFYETDFECIEDAVTVIVKTNSNHDDKYVV